MAKRQPSSRTATTPKRAPRRPPSEPPRTYLVMPELPPLPSPEQIAAANAADLARQQRPPRARPPQQCTVGCGYDARNRPVPALRLRGRWLERLGFAIGSTLRVAVREGELVVTIAPGS